MATTGKVDDSDDEDDYTPEPVNYLDYRGDMVRISHDTAYLNPPPPKPPRKRHSRWEDKVRDEIRKRKQVMAGLHNEINELEDLIE